MENFMVKKLVAGTVFYKVPGENKERTWKGENARLRIPFQELEDCMYDEAIRKLFEGGYLYVEDQQCRIALGLEIADPTEANDLKFIMTKEEAEKTLYEDDFETFKSKLENIGPGSLEIFLATALSKQTQLTIEKSDYIRKNFHVDVVMIQRQRREDEQGV